MLSFNYESNYLTELKAKLADDDFQEELFLRGSMFKNTVPKIYNYTCCISGMRVISIKQIQMVDACHIYPISLSKDDTVPNGITLSPNLHRAFDRGLITINKEYVVRVSPTLQDNNSVYGIAQFEGINVQFAKNYAHYPSQQALAWHNKEVFLLLNDKSIPCSILIPKNLLPLIFFSLVLSYL